MSKYRLEKESGGFAVVNEHREFRAGSIRTEYRVEDPYGDEIAVVRSMDEALAVLGNHLAVTPAPWEDGGAGRYLKSTHDYFDTLLVEQNLRGIREASLFGSYNTEHCSRDRYFFLIENGDQSAAPGRISFDEAAYHYGKLALRHRLGSGPSDTALQQMISNVLQRLDVLPMAA